jgi:hypothetical protein
MYMYYQVPSVPCVSDMSPMWFHVEYQEVSYIPLCLLSDFYLIIHTRFLPTYYMNILLLFQLFFLYVYIHKYCEYTSFNLPITHCRYMQPCIQRLHFDEMKRFALRDWTVPGSMFGITNLALVELLVNRDLS